MTINAPAPWLLTGDGYILLYKFKGLAASDKNGHFAAGLPYKGGFGCVMIVDYNSSDVGPYGELLLTPGKFEADGKNYYSISKIYVSSQDSVDNGRRNWGIPKELAQFTFTDQGASGEHISISSGENVFFKANAKPFGPSFPVSTSLINFMLCQSYDNRLFYTKLGGKGRARLARISIDSVDERYFPDLTGIKPIAAIKVTGFNLEFKEAVITDAPRP
ncbi:acetoacetate decarboxylase family protein [Paenibacillus sp. CAU 1782]